MPSADALDRTVRELLGEGFLARPGVAHVASAWCAPDGSRPTLRITADTPHSEVDARVLVLARARADAILTTGAILRAEPALVHALDEQARAWRAAHLPGAPEAPRSFVLTRGAGLALDHPLLAGGAALLTDERGARALAEPAAARGIELQALPSTAPRAVVAWLRERFASLLVEAGPSTTRALYGRPEGGSEHDEPAVEELLLSLFEGPALDPALRGGLLPGPDDLARHFERVSDVRVGAWRFQRFRRRG